MRNRLAAGILAMLAAACSMQNKLDTIKSGTVSPALSISEQEDLPELDAVSLKRDTLTVKDERGNEVLIMKASLDENGEMTANDVIDAATVTARFRNIAERFGKVDICFDITIPHTMQDSRWQLRFHPVLTTHDGSTELDPVIITGSDYRKAQLRGYQQYERFLSSIITDSARFYYARQLELFLRRNMPDVYRFRDDTSYVSDEVFRSSYGITEQQALEHYTNRLLLQLNNRRISMKDRRFSRYVRSPIISEGLRLDTVLTNTDDDMVYRYVQTIKAGPGLRKADITLSGEIFEQDRRLYRIPGSDPLSFYISSLSTLVDERERYLTVVTQRKASADATCSIGFEKGKTEIDPGFGDNLQEIERIRRYMSLLIQDTEFDIDSVVVTSSCSPEGNASLNRTLSLRRSESVSVFLNGCLEALRDSIRKSEGVRMSISDTADIPEEKHDIRFIPRSNGENWDMLDRLVAADSVLTESQKRDYAGFMTVRDMDMREKKMKEKSSYARISEVLYPRLRTVRFDFHLHRKGMIKDTVLTTLPDTTYMHGIQALKERDYSTAARLLSPYRDYNAAVAYCAMDYNMSAMEILDRLEPDDKVEYLKAIIYSRTGNPESAVQCYMNACRMNRSFVSRGNLDPEISSLIRAYGLNKSDDEDFYYQ